ncbi:hypothetical protein G6F57_017592 [Rhizopus arrhizus]|nr:hypothetical protein G6F57_017592 [Rhizopus arrhizus]
MTLTRYITAYLYYPVAMAVSKWRTDRNLPVGSAGISTPGGFVSSIVFPTLFTMTLAGVWHGAGLQFIVFGLLHAMYLSVNHAWRIFVVGRKPAAARKVGGIKRALCILLTFVAVLVAQAFFRAHGVGDAMLLMQGMVGLRGMEALDLSAHVAGLAWGDAWRVVVGHHLQLVYAVVLLGIAWFTPNAHQILGRYSPALFKTQEAPSAFMRWRPNAAWLVAMLALLFLCLEHQMDIKTIETKVSDIIEGIILTKVDPDTLLIDSGLVDSLAAVALALAVAREFGCKIPPPEIDVHLESVHTLAAFIAENARA